MENAASALALPAGPGVCPPPATPEDVERRVHELREHYRPYLRSLPPRLAVRAQANLCGSWRWKFEVADWVKDTPRPPQPDWHRADLDDTDWALTTVPEWRYDRSEPLGSRPSSKAPRPTNRIAWYRTGFSSAALAPDRRAFLTFAGVDWEAQVWLNGTFLGSHKGYWEAFRFDVTHCIREQNVLAVRVLAGELLGAPTTGFTVLPCVLAVEPRYERDVSRSVIGQHDLFGFKGSCFGSGFGLHREVALETTGPATVAGLRVRNNLQHDAAAIQVDTDSTFERELTVEVQLLPENFTGPAYHHVSPCRVPAGQGTLALAVPMPAAHRWTPEEPCLYRCRVSLRDAAGLVDAQDALFGCRSFQLAPASREHGNIQEGMFLLNERPIFLRGADVPPSLNALWYWHQDGKLTDAILMMKAANFNALRAGEYVQFAEVRELLDRLGMLSEQDAPGPGSVPMAVLAESCATVARACYNNPGVVLLAGSLETHFDPRDMVAAVRRVDPERILKPVSGNMLDWSYGLPPGYPTLQPEDWDHVLDDFHTYNGWYNRGTRGRMWKLGPRYPASRIVTVGEFGVEALDAYTTMLKYPLHLQPPPLTADALWGNSQVRRGDPLLTIGGRGQVPRSLGDYIEASQNYQADALVAQATGFRLSPRRIGGYFVFHFLDSLPAEWPKSIVSFDLCPKKAYYAMAQVNQPVVPLFQIADQGRTLELWVANDLPGALVGGRLTWSVEGSGRPLIHGEAPAEVPALDAALVAMVDLAALPSDTPVITLVLCLLDAQEKPLAQFRQDVFRPAWREPLEITEPARALVPKLPDTAADGDPAKVAWSKAGQLTGWRQLDGRSTRRQIEARMAHDGRHLYVRLTEAAASANLVNDEGVWAGDDWELFFAKRREKPFRQFGVNPKGTCLESTSDPALARCGARAISEVSEGRWTVAVSLPLAALLPGGLQSGSVFYANFFRSISVQNDERMWDVGPLFHDDDQLCWTPHYEPSFHLPERFGELVLL